MTEADSTAHDLLRRLLAEMTRQTEIMIQIGNMLGRLHSSKATEGPGVFVEMVDGSRVRLPGN